MAFKHQQQPAAKPTNGSDYSQPAASFSLSRSKRPYGSNSHEVPVAEDVLFEDSLKSPNATVPSEHPSRSPDTEKSPCCSPHSAVSSTMLASGPWMRDEAVDQTSPISPTADVVTTAAPRNRRNRERNRVAAHKCRQKAKRSTCALLEQEQELNSQHRILKQHADSLHSEILDLKNEILRHSNCNSEVIQSWIARSARELH